MGRIILVRNSHKLFLAATGKRMLMTDNTVVRQTYLLPIGFQKSARSVTALATSPIPAGVDSLARKFRSLLILKQITTTRFYSSASDFPG